jgi:hypothetical protein
VDGAKGAEVMLAPRPIIALEKEQVYAAFA